MSDQYSFKTTAKRRQAGHIRLGPGGTFPVLIFVDDAFRLSPFLVDTIVLYTLYAKYRRANVAPITAKCMAGEWFPLKKPEYTSGVM